MNDEIIKSRVGKTPLVRAKKLEDELNVGKIFLKLEGNNPSGRRADRLAYLLIKDAILSKKQTICLGMAGDLSKSLAYLCKHYNLKCVFVFPKKTRLLKSMIFDKSYVDIIHYGNTESDSINYSNELCSKHDYYNANLGIENNILNMTALSKISEELSYQVKEPIDEIYIQMSYGFSISGIEMGFRNLWMDNKISYLPTLNSCTIDIGNKIYDNYKNSDGSLENYKPKKSKYNKYVTISESKMMENTLDAITDAKGSIIGVSEEELLEYTKYFKSVEKIKLSIENAYSLAGFIKKAKNKEISNGNHVILLNDGHIDLQIKPYDEVSGIKIDKLVDLIHNWLMEFTDPKEEIEEALISAIEKGHVLLAILDSKIVGASVIINTGFNNFIPSYHLSYIATDRNTKGRGIATKILQEAINLTNGNISLHVESENRKAIKLYEKMGFKKSYTRMIHKMW